MQYIYIVLKKILLPFIIFSSLYTFAQGGENVYPFLNIPVSARQAALGGDAVSIRDYDVNFASVNPALLNIEMDNQLSVNVAMYLADSKYGTLSYAKDLQNGNLVFATAKYMDYGKMPRTDEAGFENGEFGASDAAIGLGYAKQFEDEWTIGASLSFVTSSIDTYSSMAVAGNAGVSYHFKKTNETVGLVFRNFGYQIKAFDVDKELLPFRVDLGYTRILTKFPAAITITAHDLQKVDISATTDVNGQEVKLPRKILDHISIGAEFFPGSAFNIRLGYNVKRGNELSVLDQRSFSGISAGFGFKVSKFRFDYAHVRYHNSSNVNQLGISLDLSGNRD